MSHLRLLFSLCARARVFFFRHMYRRNIYLSLFIIRSRDEERKDDTFFISFRRNDKQFFGRSFLSNDLQSSIVYKESPLKVLKLDDILQIQQASILVLNLEFNFVSFSVAVLRRTIFSYRWHCSLLILEVCMRIYNIPCL